MLKNNFFCWFFSPPTSLISRHPLVVGQNKFLLHFYKVPYKKSFKLPQFLRLLAAKRLISLKKSCFLSHFYVENHQIMGVTQNLPYH